MTRMNNNLYRACWFAANLQNEGKNSEMANIMAGDKYGYDASSIAYARVALAARDKARWATGIERARLWDIYNKNLAIAEE